MHDMNRLNGKTAVITGGATGIGRAAAKRFIEEGAFVFIFGRRQEALDAAVADLGPNARAVKGSVSDLADLDRLYAAVKAERGTLDIVFANAGAGSQLPLGKITAEHIDETFDTNVKGTIFTVQKALPLMGEGGSIILTGSSGGTTGAPPMGGYSASKAAVRKLARTWAEDLKGTGIRVNVLSPGPTETELAKAALGEEGMKVYASMNPLQRMADPAEIGAAAAFLASQDSSFMTASELAVDGGLAQIGRARPTALHSIIRSAVGFGKPKGEYMSYAIVGFGKIGQALAHAFARKKIQGDGESRRPPEALAPEARAIGPTVVAKSLRDALEADTIILAVPFEEHREVAKALPSWEGKTVIDATNAFGVLPEELDGLPSSAFVAKAFTGAKLVKAFNHLVAATLAGDPIVEGGHRVVFLSSDDEDAIAPVADLAKQLGFAPVKLGKLDEGGALVHARGRTWGLLIFQDLFKKEQ